MSYNRGMRRDSGRRSGDFGGGGGGGSGGGGGGGGGRRSGGNFRGNYDTYGNQMNPWEGGMVPGGSRGGSGLLPAPGQSDLLSQLSTTEAQLALASNLINKIFNQQPTSNVPSLMSLGGLGPGGPGYSSDDYGRNYQERRRGRLDGGRRAEPYSKPSALNRRLGERRFQNVGKNRNSSDRKAGASVGKSPKKDDKENKKDKDAEKTNGEVDSSQADQSKREGEEGDRDSRDESSDERKDKKNKDIRYQNIPPALLFCHVCSKNMWDESSFLKHLKGRLHQLMMDGLNEKYKLNVDLLRHEMRLAEQQREMELERKHRHGMKVYNHSREYCAMCDLHFYGNLISHRKNMRHQKLKAFLHPKCSHCNKEFSTRLEWDDHRLTPSHLMKVAEYRRATKPNLKDDEFDIDELIAPELVNCGEIISKDVQIVTQQQTEDDVVESKDTTEPKEGTEEKDKDKEKEKAEGAEEAEKQAQTFRGIDVDPAKLPKYSASVPIGQDLVTNVDGFMCRACNCFMPGDWADTHCRTLTHYNNYCNLVRAKARVSARQKREDQAKEKTLKEKKDKSASGDDEGNWKRRKVTKDGEEEEEDQEESVAEDGKEGDGNVTEEKMEVEEVKDGEESETKPEAPESAWEEIDKDIEAAEVSKEEGEEENPDGANEEEVQTVATRGRKGARGNAKGKAKRGK